MKNIQSIIKYALFPALFLCFTSSSFAQQENISVHDPCIIKQGNVYHIYCTGRGISSWYSTDLEHWTKGKPVFEQAPEWTHVAVPGFRNFFWAPDISYHNGQYYLFYAVSAFGKNTSCIGVATNKTLDEKNPDIVFLDLLMPCKDGRQCLREIRANKKYDAIPIIVYSSLSDLQNIEFCYREGSNLYAIKPHTLTELKVILEKIFSIDWKKVLYFPPRSMFVLNQQ